VAEVITGEAVVIDVPYARFPSRTLALAIDIVVQLVLLFALSGVAIAAGAGGGLDVAAIGAISLSVSVLVIVGYPTIFETLSRGRSLGKLALGLRVVSSDGGPERFRQALMRALLAVLEIWVTFGFLALVTSLISANGKRLGDIFAGTFVITERLPKRRGSTPPMSALPPALASWAAGLELSGLADATAETARQYLSRYYDFTPAAREEFGQRIAAAVAAQVSPAPPPGTAPPDYLSAVLAERRGREQARMTAQVSPAGGQAMGGPAPAAPIVSGPVASDPAGHRNNATDGEPTPAPADQAPSQPADGHGDQAGPQREPPDAATERRGGFLPPR
jgi:uncharacterized RDD family membrane protein YckC